MIFFMSSSTLCMLTILSFTTSSSTPIAWLFFTALSLKSLHTYRGPVPSTYCQSLPSFSLSQTNQSSPLTLHGFERSMICSQLLENITYPRQHLLSTSSSYIPGQIHPEASVAFFYFLTTLLSENWPANRGCSLHLTFSLLLACSRPGLISLTQLSTWMVNSHVDNKLFCLIPKVI